MRWPKTAPPILSHVMLLGIDPLEGVLDAKPLVHILELFTADQFPRAAIGGLEAAVVHAVVVGDDLRRRPQPMTSYAPLNGCLKATRPSLTASSKVLAMVFSFLVVDKIISPGNYLKAHT